MDFDDRQFEHIVRDLVVNEQAFLHEMQQTTPPRRSYVIVFTARSGSTWLTSVLSGTNLMGHPEEYINPEFVLDVAKFLNCRRAGNFLGILSRRRKTANGIFGIETREADIRLFGEDIFFKAFNTDTVFFNLWRENIVAQAISLYRAVTTKRYHSNEEAESLSPPVYDGNAIKEWLSHLAEAENSNLTMLQERHPVFKNICYENIVRDRSGTLKMFADALEVQLDLNEFAAPAASELKKISDDWNKEAEHRFRTERSQFLSRIEEGRLVKKLVPPEGTGLNPAT
ncbi:MAG: Stf0 family sulfotransferase [Anaerolineaceae bacterium]|nr:Stf0 family sulfotransferase [Anaerolineaceae bacterium]